jgi:DNA-binding ferritin-like protein
MGRAIEAAREARENRRKGSLMRNNSRSKFRAARRNPGDPALYQDVLAHLRAIHWLAWTAHWAASGPNAYGDHLLLQRIYAGEGGAPNIEEAIDTLGEKMVAYFGTESVHPAVIGAKAQSLVEKAAASGQGRLGALLALEHSLQVAIRVAWKANQAAGDQMSLGIDDYLMGLANEHDTAVYLLKQRLQPSSGRALTNPPALEELTPVNAYDGAAANKLRKALTFHAHPDRLRGVLGREPTAAEVSAASRLTQRILSAGDRELNGLLQELRGGTAGPAPAPSRTTSPPPPAPSRPVGAVVAEAVANMVPIPGKKFAIGKYEVTQELYEAVTGKNPSRFKGRPQNPVEMVNWYEAVEFCKKLSERTGLPFRLPTEEEWEYAARGGQDYAYAGSNDPDEVAWYRDNSGDTTHPVGLKKPNGYGLYDMSGNVWEWNSSVEDGGALRVCRGGCWYYPPADARVSLWDGLDPGYRNDYLGVRLALDLPTPALQNSRRSRRR